MRRIAWVLALAACGGGGDISSTGAGEQKALEFYSGGNLEKAEEALRGTKSSLGLRLLGRVQLYRSRLRDAAESLTRAAKLLEQEMAKMKQSELLQAREEMALIYLDLATAHYRLDDFATASRIYGMLGDGVLLAKYGAKALTIPYVLHWDDEPSYLPFVSRDPVPTVRIRVNDTKGLFAIDTGAGELTLDDDFAKKAGFTGAGVRIERFLGALQEGIVESVTVGSVRVNNVPVHIRKLQKMDGLIGANFLLHFGFTIDYKKERMLLRPASKPQPMTGTEVPFYVVGERFIIVPGTVTLPKEVVRKDRPDRFSVYFLLSTGMAKVPFSPSQGLAWTMSQSITGSLRIETASFGPVTLSRPAFDPFSFPSGLDTAFGFTIGGAVGHEALRDRLLTFDPSRSVVAIE